MQLVLGTVYAWSVFKKPFLASHGVDAGGTWGGAQVGLVFTIVMVCLASAAALGGKFVDKAGARKVATLAAILFGIGTMLTGFADKTGNIWVLYLSYGLIAGIGNGLGYITPIAVLVRWFPDKRGLITGLAVMGFGLGASIMGQVAPLLLPKLGLTNFFFVFGAIFMVVLLAAAQKLVNPPEGWTPPAPVQKKAAAPAQVSVDAKTAFGMPQFYILWAILCVNIAAGLALLSNLSPMAQKQLAIDPKKAGTVLLIGSLFNGLGRIFWASLSDKIGRKTTFFLILGTQIPAFLALPYASSYTVFVALCCYILACFGGGFATMPAYAADTFGPKNMGGIYGKILLAWGLAGVIGPMVMEAVYKKTQTFATALMVAAGLLVVGFLINVFYRKPQAVASPPAG